MSRLLLGDRFPAFVSDSSEFSMDLRDLFNFEPIAGGILERKMRNVSVEEDKKNYRKNQEEGYFVDQWGSSLGTIEPKSFPNPVLTFNGIQGGKNRH